MYKLEGLIPWLSINGQLRLPYGNCFLSEMRTSDSRKQKTDTKYLILIRTSNKNLPLSLF